MYNKIHTCICLAFCSRTFMPSRSHKYISYKHEEFKEEFTYYGIMHTCIQAYTPCIADAIPRRHEKNVPLYR